MTTRLVQPFMNFLPKALAEGKYVCASGPWIVERSLEFIRAPKTFVFSGGGHYNLKLVFGYSLNISRFQGVITAFPMYYPWLYPSPRAHSNPTLQIVWRSIPQPGVLLHTYIAFRDH